MSQGATIAKRTTGVRGLDDVTCGGLPAAGAALVSGGPGAGKTVLALQIVANAAKRGEAGIVVAFEESSDRLLQHARGFAFADALHDAERVLTLDARPRSDATVAGDFDLEGLLAALADAAARMDATWVVLDGLDQLLSLQENRSQALVQLRRLDDWSVEQSVSVLLTSKRATGDQEIAASMRGTEYLLSTVIDLSTTLVHGKLNRRFRIVKYRGSPHVSDELPMLLTHDGIQLPYGLAGDATVGAQTRAEGAERGVDPSAPASSERIGTGVPDLDDVLAGGPYRGSTTLISGSPGTSKTTLAASIAATAAEHGERALFVSFDEAPPSIVRNAASVGMDLQRHVASGRMRIEGRTAWSGLVEEHFVAIANELAAFDPSVLVIDPVSALLKASSAESAYLSIERLLALGRARGVTTVLTSLGEGEDPASEATLSHTSTLADTWIVLSYHVVGGERNRALSVVKSRGTAHSNQVRELILSAHGIDLAEPYPFGSEVLMGTARLQKESERAAETRAASDQRDRRLHDIEEHLTAASRRREEAVHEEQRLHEALQQERASDANESSDRAHHADRVQRRRTPGPNPPAGTNGESRGEAHETYHRRSEEGGDRD
ncbi:MAG: ATPase domain-containing protein [Trueperaceae bacterium]